MKLSNVTEVAEAMRLLGSAYRGDWSDFDGRSLKLTLVELAEALESDEPFDARRWAAGESICPEAHAWAEHCDKRGPSASLYSCSHVERILAAGVAAPEGDDT